MLLNPTNHAIVTLLVGFDSVDALVVLEHDLTRQGGRDIEKFGDLDADNLVVFAVYQPIDLTHVHAAGSPKRPYGTDATISRHVANDQTLIRECLEGRQKVAQKRLAATAA